LLIYNLLYGFKLINHFKAKFYLMTEIENEALNSHVNLVPFSCPVDANWQILEFSPRAGFGGAEVGKTGKAGRAQG
jgi:hypothetical protein